MKKTPGKSKVAKLSAKWSKLLHGNANSKPAVLLESKQQSLVGEQPMPKKNKLPAVWDLVIKDMQSRDLVGLERYKTRLQPHNGRDALIDAYQEILDAAVYLRQLIYERNGN